MTMQKIVILFLLYIIVSGCGAGSSDLRGSEAEDADDGDPSIPQGCSIDQVYDAFVSEWQVQAGDTVRLPLPEGFRYNFAVDWGDASGGKDGHPYVSSFDDPDTSHTYSKAGNYKVSIYGMVEAWSFAAIADSKDMIVAVDSLGDAGWKNLQGAFAGCTNLGKVAGGETSEVRDMSDMFAGATSLQLDVSRWNFKQVRRMEGMFSGVTLPDATYNELLSRIVETTKQKGVLLDAGDSYYSGTGVRDHQTLTGADWEIKDSGQRFVLDE